MGRLKRAQDMPAGPDDGPERTCAVTRAPLAPDELIRFVLSPDGDVVPDLDRKLPGRGVWVGATKETVEQAVARKVFARGFKQPVNVPGGLEIAIEGLLTRRVISTLALANKAGLAVAGFQQVDSALDKGSVAILLHGSDAAADGCHKLDRKFKAIQRDRGGEACIINSLTIAEMSLAMGRPSVVHAGLIPGGLTDRLLREAGRLARYQSRSKASGQPFSDVSNEGSTDIA